MKSIPTQARAIKKRIALLKAAVSEFSEGNFEAATAKSIASRAGVATGTFYQYFENKNDILRVIAENRYSQLDEQITILENLASEQSLSETPDAKALFTQVLGFLYEFHRQDGPLHQVLDQRRGLDEELNAIIERGEGLMQSHVEMFVEQFDVEQPRLVAASLFAMGEGLVHRMVFGVPPKDPEAMLKIGAQMLASFFLKRPPM